MKTVRSVRWEDAYAVIEPQINAAGVHVWPFQPDFPLDVRYLVLRREADIRMNIHDYFELLFLCSGEVVYQVGNRKCPMRQGDLFVMSGTLPHRMTQYGHAELRAVVLYFLPELIRAHDPTGDDVEYLMPFLVQDNGFPHIIKARSSVPSEVFHLIEKLHKELPAATERSRLTARTYLKMILVLLGNHYAKYAGSERVFSHRQRNLDRLRPLFSHIENWYPEPITVDDAAAAVNMSKSHFMRFFKQVTGQPFVSHLNQFRVVKAQKLIATTDLSIADVGQEVGFCNQSYFGLVFRRLTGMSPRQYKMYSTKAESHRGPKKP